MTLLLTHLRKYLIKKKKKPLIGNKLSSGCIVCFVLQKTSKEKCVII